VAQIVTVHGYHGTSQEAADRILAGEDFFVSENDTDWLGDGVYFFQDAPYRSRDWPMMRLPEFRRIPNPAVLCAEIELVDCLDLIDIKAGELVKKYYPRLKAGYRRLRQKIPQNKGGQRRRDRTLINYAIEHMKSSGESIGTVRAAFVEGRPIVPGSQLYSHAHVQIVVRPERMEAIKNVWRHDFEGGE